MDSIEDLLADTFRRGASDLHLIAGQPARMRYLGDLATLNQDELSQDYVQDQLYRIMPSEIREAFERDDQADFAYWVEDVARFRVNVLRHINGIGAVFRAIPEKAYSLEDLKLPDVVPSFCVQNQGLVLVTGKTGSGKSTTLAAMVDYINSNRKGHIITIEDPIEFVHGRKRCLISQRELGAHTRSFGGALRSALREDPDVILIGELRDLETMSLAVTAAETGILVFGTLHTNGAVSTVDRMVNAFPIGKQPQVRAMLATSLRGVISQQLVKTADGKSRVAAVEIMVNNAAVASILRDGRTEQLENALQTGGLQGMQSMDTSLRRLLDAGMITGEDAYEVAFRKADFEGYRNAG
jgi:twitching motility protein PilT